MMLDESQKKLYFFFHDELLDSIFSETSLQINNFQDFEFQKLNLSEIDIFESKYIICDLVGIEELNSANVKDKFEKIYLLSHNDSNQIDDEKLVVNYLPIKLINFIHYILNDFKQALKKNLQIIKFKNIKYDHSSRKILSSDIEFQLTEKENEIFSYLLSTDDSATKDKLLSEIWNYKKSIDTHTLETHIYSLRKKLEEKLNINNILVHKKDGYFLNKEKL